EDRDSGGDVVDEMPGPVRRKGLGLAASARCHDSGDFLGRCSCILCQLKKRETVLFAPLFSSATTKRSYSAFGIAVFVDDVITQIREIQLKQPLSLVKANNTAGSRTDN